jgi:hypothetical protein
VHPPENEKELYDELADRLDAQDDTGARRVFHELQKTGRSRQEIVAQVSRLIEKRREDKPLGKSTGEIPWLRHREPSTWSHTPFIRPQHRFDIPVAGTSGEPELPPTGDDTSQRAGAPDERSPAPQPTAASGVPEQPLTNQKTIAHTENAIHSGEWRQGALFENIRPRQIGADLSVAERAASKLNLQTALLAEEAKPSASTEAKDQPTAVQRASRASARRIGIVLTGISVIAAASAGLFVLWNLYGSEVQEFVSARPPSALAWLQKIGGINNGSFSPDAGMQRQSTGPQKAGAVDERNQTPKQEEPSAAQAPTDRSIRIPEAAVTEPPIANKQGTRTERNTGDTSAPPTAQIAEELLSQTAAPSSQVAEPVTVPTAAPARSQQNESDAAQAQQTVARQVPPIDTGALVVQGDQLLAKSDVASARLLYQRAAEAGDGRGALRMGMTFDPVLLARWRLRGVRANRAQAIAWYRHASALGNADAELRRRSLVTYAVRRRRYY